MEQGLVWNLFLCGKLSWNDFPAAGDVVLPMSFSGSACVGRLHRKFADDSEEDKSKNVSGQFFHYSTLVGEKTVPDFMSRLLKWNSTRGKVRYLSAYSTKAAVCLFSPFLFIFSKKAAPQLINYSQQLASALSFIANHGIVLRVSWEIEPTIPFLFSLQIVVRQGLFSLSIEFSNVWATVMSVIIFFLNLCTEAY